MSVKYRGETFTGYNKPKSSSSGKKSHVVLNIAKGPTSAAYWANKVKW